MVLISHCYPLTGIAYEPFSARLGGYDTGGGMAVAAFFVISGFLIARSAQKQNWIAFASARILRIVPALAIVVALQYVIVGPIFTKLSLGDYFTSAFGHLSGIFVFDVQLHLPGVFENLPNKSINGSLWTIPIEALFYLLTAIFVAFGVLRSSTAIYLSATAIASHLYLIYSGFNWSNPGPLVFSNVTAYHFTKLASFYFSGAAVWHLRDKIKLDIGIIAILLLLLYTARIGIAKQLVYLISLPYIVLFLGFYRYVEFGFYKKIGDISYGTYLYAFPIQQIIIEIFSKEIGPWKLAALSIPLTLFFAYISWIFIEKPSLSLKSRLNSII